MKVKMSRRAQNWRREEEDKGALELPVAELLLGDQKEGAACMGGCRDLSEKTGGSGENLGPGHRE